MIKDYEKILAPYWQKGGNYVIPTGIVNDLLGELEDLESENKYLLALQKALDKQYEELESVLNEVRKYIKDKIKKSFEVDCGISNIRSDRLMTETVVELQLIEEMVNKALEKKG